MVQRVTITPQEDQEYKQALAEYDDATRLAVAALSKGGGAPESPAYQEFLRQDARAGKAIKRIKEILGD